MHVQVFKGKLHRCLQLILKYTKNKMGRYRWIFNKANKMLTVELELTVDYIGSHCTTLSTFCMLELFY